MEEAHPHYDVEIHLLTSQLNQKELSTYYKYKERKMASLMRLYSNEADHLILLHDKSMDFSWWIEQIEEMPSNWKKPSLHIIQTVSNDLS